MAASSSLVKVRASISSSISALLCRCSSSTAGETGFTKQIENDEASGGDLRPPPNPIPNRPLRRERPFRSRSVGPQPPPSPSRFAPNQNAQFQGQSRTRPIKDVISRTANQEESVSDAAFLDRFKLRPNKVEADIKDPRTAPTVVAGESAPQKEGDDEPHRSSNKPDHSRVQAPPPDADEIFKKMKETGLIPNAVAMLDGLCKDGLVQDAMKLFGQMREKGSMPDVVVYTAVVDGFCKARKPDDAKRIFTKMVNNQINPNAFTYTVLIQGLYKCGNLDDAVDFAGEMLEAGHSPNVATFVGLVDAFCKEKGVEEAQSVIKSLRQKGMFLNDKAVREFLDKNAPLSSSLWEAIFGKKPTQKLF
ncbi:Pentatricopeptide repeat-containing protein At4g38150 [Linum grandiflorum]